MRKCSVEIISGFLSSGKTTFLNGFIKKTLKREEVVVIQCENGKESIYKEAYDKGNISIKNFKSNEELTEERLIRLAKFYKPSRLIIESNGISDLNRLLNVFNSLKVRSYFKITGVITLVNASTFSAFYKNLGHLIIPAIECSDLIILNYCHMISKETEESYIKILEGINNHAHIVAANDREDLKSKIQKVKIIS